MPSTTKADEWIAHDLKTLPESFEPIWTGAKRFEITQVQVSVGERIALSEWDPKAGYTGRVVYVRVTHVDAGAIQSGVIVFGFRFDGKPSRERRKTE